MSGTSKPDTILSIYIYIYVCMCVCVCVSELADIWNHASTIYTSLSSFCYRSIHHVSNSPTPNSTRNQPFPFFLHLSHLNNYVQGRNPPNLCIIFYSLVVELHYSSQSSIKWYKRTMSSNYLAWIPQDQVWILSVLVFFLKVFIPAYFSQFWWF